MRNKIQRVSTKCGCPIPENACRVCKNGGYTTGDRQQDNNAKFWTCSVRVNVRLSFHNFDPSSIACASLDECYVDQWMLYRKPIQGRASQCTRKLLSRFSSIFVQILDPVKWSGAELAGDKKRGQTHGWVFGQKRRPTWQVRERRKQGSRQYSGKKGTCRMKPKATMAFLNSHIHHAINSGLLYEMTTIMHFSIVLDLQSCELQTGLFSTPICFQLRITEWIITAFSKRV